MKTVTVKFFGRNEPCVYACDQFFYQALKNDPCVYEIMSNQTGEILYTKSGFTSYCGVGADYDQWDFMERYGHYHKCKDFNAYMSANDCCGIFQEDIDQYIREILAEMVKAGIKVNIIKNDYQDTIAVYD